jgi:zinc transport system substrate-binding protein
MNDTNSQPPAMSRYAKGAAALGALLCCALIFSCAKSRGQLQNDSDDAKLLVVASFYTMADFAQKIGGERVSVRVLIPAGQDAHDWEPSPRDIAALESASVFIYNGAGFEPWAKDLLAAVSNKRLAAVEAGAGFDLIADDPHIWLSPLGAKHALKNIALGFARADPPHAALYEQAYGEYAARCDSLHEELSAALREAGLQKEFITVHAAFGYLAREYGLTQLSAGSGAGADEPSPLAMRRIISHAKEQNIRAVFYEEAVSKKTAQAIAREIDGSAVFLNPLESLSAEQARAGEDYFSVMQKNLAALAAALRPR